MGWILRIIVAIPKYLDGIIGGVQRRREIFNVYTADLLLNGYMRNVVPMNSR
jgi:hypothetical protein